MGSAADATVLYEEREGIGIITLNRPEKLNALNPTVLDDLEAALRRLTANRGVRVGVLHGAGRAFLAGADIAHYVDLTIHEYRAFMDRGTEVHDQIIECPKPIVAAVHGYAVGGGFEIALCCDLIVAERDAQLGLPEIKLGLLPGGGGTQRLPRIIGERRALELLLTGRTISADEAHQWGVVSRVADPGEGMAAALELAARIARSAPIAARLAKRLVREGASMPLGAALHLEHAETAALYVTEDAAEGIRAFVEKRRPVFDDH